MQECETTGLEADIRQKVFRLLHHLGSEAKATEKRIIDVARILEIDVRAEDVAIPVIALWNTHAVLPYATEEGTPGVLRNASLDSTQRFTLSAAISGVRTVTTGEALNQSPRSREHDELLRQTAPTDDGRLDAVERRPQVIESVKYEVLIRSHQGRETEILEELVPESPASDEDNHYRPLRCSLMDGRCFPEQQTRRSAVWTARADRGGC